MKSLNTGEAVVVVVKVTWCMVNAFLPALFLMTEAAFPVGAVYKMNPLDSC